MLQTHAITKAVIFDVVCHYSCFQTTCDRFFSRWAAALPHMVFLPDDDASALANTEGEDADDAVARSAVAFAFDDARLSLAV